MFTRIDNRPHVCWAATCSHLRTFTRACCIFIVVFRIPKSHYCWELTNLVPGPHGCLTMGKVHWGRTLIKLVIYSYSYPIGTIKHKYEVTLLVGTSILSGLHRVLFFLVRSEFFYFENISIYLSDSNQSVLENRLFFDVLVLLLCSFCNWEKWNNWKAEC